MSGIHKGLLALCCALCLAGAVAAQATAPARAARKADQPQPKSCGNLDKDNRPNACARLVDGSWVMFRSKCTKLAEGKFRYTHCSGSTMDMNGADQCCLQSDECPGSLYVGRCLGR